MTSASTPSLRELGGRVEGERDHRPVRHDRQVAAGAPDGGLPDRDDAVALGEDLLRPPVEELVLEEEDRVVVADRRLEEAAGVGGGRGDDDREAGRPGEVALGALRVERPGVDAGARRPADDDRDAEAGPVAVLRREVRDHVERPRGEVEELHLDDRPEAPERGADRRADDRLLDDRACR